MQEDQREQELKQEEAKGKKSKLPVIIGLTAAVIVVAAAGAFAALRLFASNPKVAVAKAFVSLLGDPQKSPMEELFGISQMQKNALTGDFQEEFEVSLTGISDEDLSILEGAELNGQSQVSRTDDQYYGSVGLVYKGLHLGQLEAYYAPGEMLQAAIPDFSSRVFQIELGEELEDQIYQWFLWDEMETTQEEKEAFAQYFSEQLNGLTQEELSFSQLWSRFSESASAVTEFTEAVQAEKAGKETFQMDGKESAAPDTR